VPCEPAEAWGGGRRLFLQTWVADGAGTFVEHLLPAPPSLRASRRPVCCRRGVLSSERAAAGAWGARPLSKEGRPMLPGPKMAHSAPAPVHGTASPACSHCILAAAAVVGLDSCVCLWFIRGAFRGGGRLSVWWRVVVCDASAACGRSGADPSLLSQGMARRCIIGVALHCTSLRGSACVALCACPRACARRRHGFCGHPRFCVRQWWWGAAYPSLPSQQQAAATMSNGTRPCAIGAVPRPHSCHARTALGAVLPTGSLL